MEDTFQDDTLLARWLSGAISDAERHELEAHPDYPVFRRIVDAADGLRLPDARVQAMWDNLSPALAAKTRSGLGGRSYQRWLWIGMAAAASLTLAIFAWTFWGESGRATPAIVATTTGEQKTATLPDGSTVRLNAVSSVEVFGKNWAQERRVHLIGEAFFQVQKGQAPFIVETAAGSVFVLGTSFTVRYRGTAFEVACYDGFVQASIPNGAKQALRAGQKAISHNGSWQPLGALTDSWPGWMQGESRFNDAPLYEVLAELQRQYNVHIDVSGAEGRRFSGAFVQGDLNLALRMVCEPLGLQYAVSNNVVNIHPK